MEFIDVCILILALGIVLCVVRYHILKKRSGKSGGCSGCNSGCNTCPMGGSSSQNPYTKKEKEKENEE